MKGVIIYKGKYGATQKYAHWLAEETQFEVYPSSAINDEKLKKYDFFVIGSSVYIGKLQIGKWLKRNLPYLKGRKVFFFQVAGTPPDQEVKRKEYNLSGPRQIMDNCKCFYLPGKMIIKDLSWFERFMLKMGARIAKNPEDRKQMLSEYNDVHKENIREIAKAIQQFSISAPLINEPS